MSEFTDYVAVRRDCPLLLGLVGPSGSGKTFSALELATGIVGVKGGEIFFIDTEAGRALHYADRFKFRHVPFHPPFSPARYKSAIEYCVGRGATCIIIDSMTHEHSGDGGVLDMAERFLEDKCGHDFAKRERMKLLSFAKPKAERKALNNYIVQLGSKCAMILCYRAHEKLDFVNKVDGKPRPLGFQPETTSPLMYEMAQQFLLRPCCDGVPELMGNTPEEKTIIKSPSQFRDWFTSNQRLSAEIGARFAKWAQGDVKADGATGDATKPSKAPTPPATGWLDPGPILYAITNTETLEDLKAAYGEFHKARKDYSLDDCAMITAAKDAAKERLES